MTLLISSAVVAAVSAVVVRLAQAVALRKALLDVPNERSSHKVPIPRLGGAAFIPIVLAVVGGLWLQVEVPFVVKVAFFVATMVLFATSLVDDFQSLSTAVRFGVQFFASGLFLSATISVCPLPFAGLLGVLLSVAVVTSAVGLLNIYNFIDGIDGIAGLQAVAGGLVWFIIAGQIGAPAAAMLGVTLAAGAFGFLTLNWPPAKIFMGDAGSTVVGFIFGVMPLLVWVETRGGLDLVRLLIVAAIVVWPFLADGTFTILRRLKKRENIFKAHRSHLYQRLVIAGKSHRNVTLVYGGLAAIGGVLAWWVAVGTRASVLGSAFVVGSLFFALWRWTVQCESLH